VYEAKTGRSLASYQLASSAQTFVNDVIVTKNAAWFTESSQPVLYRVPIASNGALGAQSGVKTVPLGGDFEFVAGFNTNGIDATPNGKTLVIVQSNLGPPVHGRSRYWSSRPDRARRWQRRLRRRDPARRQDALRRPEPVEPGRRRGTGQRSVLGPDCPAPDRSSARRTDDDRRVRQQLVRGQRPLRRSGTQSASYSIVELRKLD
jgi:hypothetical protein